jgi:hypothetical protein
MPELGLVEGWLAAAESRYLADLTKAELGRALRALSSVYVERRGKLASGGALDTAGKRAAFALFYAPLHFLLVQQIHGGLTPLLGQPSQSTTYSDGVRPLRDPLVDLGCGTGAAGAAWALATGGPSSRVFGYDVNSWAVREAEWTYRTLELHGSAARVSADRVRLPRGRSVVLAAFLINELSPPTRSGMRDRLMAAARDGHAVIVIEPIARRVTPWWSAWEETFVRAGGRADEWRFTIELPEPLRQLDRAAGLDHRELTARTLAIALPSNDNGRARSPGRQT